jgi:hypothetical protein
MIESRPVCEPTPEKSDFASLGGFYEDFHTVMWDFSGKQRSGEGKRKGYA